MSAWREVLVAAAAAGGWGLLTWGLAELTSPIAWRISGGLFLLSLCGWGFLLDLVRDGLYTLSMSRRRE